MRRKRMPQGEGGGGRGAGRERPSERGCPLARFIRNLFFLPYLTKESLTGKAKRPQHT